MVVVALTFVMAGGEIQMVMADDDFNAMPGTHRANPTYCYDGQEICRGNGNEVVEPNE
jgi:hypothetical protein